ncbi:hypothetical protein D9M73_242850 [compost metagenome]
MIEASIQRIPSQLIQPGLEICGLDHGVLMAVDFQRIAHRQRSQAALGGLITGQLRIITQRHLELTRHVKQLLIALLIFQQQSGNSRLSDQRGIAVLVLAINSRKAS